MRVLVLHPKASSASTLHTTLSKLEERLWSQHGIELVFVDAPLLDVTVGRSLGCANNDGDGDGDGVGGESSGDRSGGGSGLNEIEEGEIMSRRWYVEEECIDERRTLIDDNNADNNNNNDSSNNNNSAPQHTKKKKRVQYSGLDASLLHLTQIWSRGGASSSSGVSNSNNEPCLQLPFQGILGFGQGANVAAMLPLLNHAGDAYNNNDDDEEDEDEEKINMDGGKKCIFEGLQFVIFVDGRDIMNQEDDDDVIDSNASINNNGDEEEEEEDSWYVGPNGISSLHLIAETTTANCATTNNSKRQSELLAKRYGPNATIQYYKPNTKKTNKPSSSSSTTQQYNTPSLHNLLGHHLVLQKKTLLSNPTSRKLLSLQTQLYTVEQLATIAITNEIKMNPPKCLMAMIGPSIGGGGSSGGGKENCQNDDNDEDDKTKKREKKQNEEKMNSSEQEVQIVGKTVGAWQGPGRVFGEQGGGAPCPESFLLRQEDRVAVVADGGDGGSSGGNDDKKKSSSVTVTASLL